MKFSQAFTDKEKIQLLQRWILVQSIAYYQLNENIASDFEYDANALQLIDLMRKYPAEAKQSQYHKYFHDYCPSTDDAHYTSGFDLITRVEKSKKLYKIISHDAYLALKIKKEKHGEVY